MASMRYAVCLVWALALAAAHPMGSFSFNRYASIRPQASRVEIVYAVDLAESPSFDLLRAWGVAAGSPAFERRAELQARAWVGGLRIGSGGVPVEPQVDGVAAEVGNGSGGMATLRITARLSLVAPRPSLEFEDHNFDGKPGWSEIVIEAGPGVGITRASHSDRDRSRALTVYPLDREPAPYDSRASLQWQVGAASAGPPTIEPIAQPQAPAPEGDAREVPRDARSDFLSALLGRRDLGLGVVLAGLAVAFGLGALHALSPGHGKTIVAAYLVGSRGTLRHALLLGATVTFTHTISVFLLGLGTLFLSRFVVPERIYPVLGVVSGLAIVAVGGTLLWKRARHALAHHHGHAHHHHHGAEGHHHHVEGAVTMGSLLALGASGGLVPCPSALVLLLSAIALGRVGLGLVLLVAFSLGLAVVLMAIGAAVLYAKSWLPNGWNAAAHPGFRLIPVASALVIVCLGLLMTAVSLGWVRPGGVAG
jgi:ABC-type nickel/cobalt efflux system permease component RcnA